MLFESPHLAARRQKLIARCAEQREDMIRHGQSVTHSMSVLDSAMHYFHRIKQHPVWIIGAVLGVLALRPLRIAGLMQGSAVALRNWRSVAPVLQRMLARGYE